MDFTITKYKQLIDKLKEVNYEFQTFDQFIVSPHSRSIVLRHDVDLLPTNSLAFAKIQNQNNNHDGVFRE